MTDVLIVGSGASAVHAAWPLVEAGLQVVMVDYGNVDETYAPLIPDEPFSRLRRTDWRQHVYFLGRDFEGVPLGRVRVGAQLTPPRRHVTADVDRLLPLRSATFEPTESLALGGLAAAWGAGVAPFGDEDLRGLPIGRADLEPHYARVAERIGVSGDGDDDLLPFIWNPPWMQPALEIDAAAEAILTRYAGRRDRLNGRGFYLGRPRAAILTRPHRGREAQRYHDMDFWSDAGRSVWRPQWEVQALRAHPNFCYLPRRLALRFEERAGAGVRLQTRHAGDGAIETRSARALILAAGTLATARIVLRSLGRYEAPVPVVSNPYVYLPALNLGMIGRPGRDRRHSLTQLTAIYRPPGAEGAPVVAQYYSYRSLLMFKLLKEAPLPLREALPLMRDLTPLFGIWGVHHPDLPGPGKRLALRAAPGGEDVLEVVYEPTAEELDRRRRVERRLVGFLRRLGCWPLRRIDPGPGGSIHYAGTFPMTEPSGELTCDARGRLFGTAGVYLADGSLFAALPAKGLTFTMMANADRVGTALGRRLTAEGGPPGP